MDMSSLDMTPVTAQFAKRAAQLPAADHDAKSSQIIYAYAMGKAGDMNQIQSTAEACAKHLKAFIEKQEK